MFHDTSGKINLSAPLMETTVQVGIGAMERTGDMHETRYQRVESPVNDGMSKNQLIEYLLNQF